MEHGLETSVLSDVVLPIALAVIMFGMGMSLTWGDFRRVGGLKLAVGVGLVAQLLVLPVLAMGVAIAFTWTVGLAPHLALGLVLLACVPGGATSNMLAYLARADAALSVTLTSIVSLASAFVTPLVFFGATTILFGDASLIQVSLVEMMMLVLVIVAIPILLGMLVRAKRPGFAARAERPARILSVAFLAIVIAGVIVQNGDQFWSLAAQSVPAALTLNLLALGAGFLVARIARLARPQARAISIEIGFQNGTLAIALAVGQLGSPQAAVVPGFYSLVMFVTGGALAWWWARSTPRDARENEDEDVEIIPAS